jgi:hypothetical protein
VELAARLAERDADAKKARQPDNSKSGMAFAFGDGEKPRFWGLAHSETECEKAFRAAWKELCREDPLFVYIPSIMASLGYARVTEERLSDAEVGKAIRGLRPKEGHHGAVLEAQVGRDGTTFYRITYTLSATGRPPFTTQSTVAHPDIADAIREYNERKD